MLYKNITLIKLNTITNNYIYIYIFFYFLAYNYYTQCNKKIVFLRKHGIFKNFEVWLKTSQTQSTAMLIMMITTFEDLQKSKSNQ